jgi:putative phosphoribosyl transferase
MKMTRTTTSESQRAVIIEVEAGVIEGTLGLPESATGLVLFAHGSGSSRNSPRNRFVAESLHSAGLGTLLVDLLTADEERIDAQTGRLRFDIGLLSQRLLTATDWLGYHEETRNLEVGYFGASTGAAAALIAAAERPNISAVVSRGGRPDLAGPSLAQVQAATLLIVGSNDYQVVELNKRAYNQLRRTRAKELKLVPGATHLFEEPGTLEQVAELAGGWFTTHLIAGSSE